MPTASFTKFNPFIEGVFEAQFNFGSDTFKVMLSNQAPAAGNTQRSDITELSTSGGYTVGGQTVPILTSSQTSGTYTATVNTTLTWTGSGGGFGPFPVCVYVRRHKRIRQARRGLGLWLSYYRCRIRNI